MRVVGQGLGADGDGLQHERGMYWRGAARGRSTGARRGQRTLAELHASVSLDTPSRRLTAKGRAHQ